MRVCDAMRAPAHGLVEALSLQRRSGLREVRGLVASLEQLLERPRQSRLVFVERWVDRAALLAHFAVPESGAFVRAAAALCAEPPSIRVFEAEEVALR